MILLILYKRIWYKILTDKIKRIRRNIRIRRILNIRKNKTHKDKEEELSELSEKKNNIKEDFFLRKRKRHHLFSSRESQVK